MYLEFQKSFAQMNISNASICVGCENICFLKCSESCTSICMAGCSGGAKRVS